MDKEACVVAICATGSTMLIFGLGMLHMSYNGKPFIIVGAGILIIGICLAIIYNIYINSKVKHITFTKEDNLSLRQKMTIRYTEKLLAEEELAKNKEGDYEK